MHWYQQVLEWSWAITGGAVVTLWQAMTWRVRRLENALGTIATKDDVVRLHDRIDAADTKNDSAHNELRQEMDKKHDRIIEILMRK